MKNLKNKLTGLLTIVVLGTSVTSASAFEYKRFGESVKYAKASGAGDYMMNGDAMSALRRAAEPVLKDGPLPAIIKIIILEVAPAYKVELLGE
jgi:hypothetical protein